MELQQYILIHILELEKYNENRKKNINGKPENEHENLFGVHVDNEKYYFFESVEERNSFFKELDKNEMNEKEIIELKTDISNIDIDSLTDEQLKKVATRL